MAAKPGGVVIPKRLLKNMWNHNPHGLGFVVAVNNSLVLKKGYRNFREFWKNYRVLQKYPAIIHMRWANRGVVSSSNDHPFLVTDSLAFAHNGTINIELEKDNSDTKMFCENILKPLHSRDENFLEKDFNLWLLSKSIGHSKLAFLDSSGKITIVNKTLGEQEENGIWFSNKDYKNYAIVPSKTAWLTGSEHVKNRNFHQAVVEAMESKYENYY